MTEPTPVQLEYRELRQKLTAIEQDITDIKRLGTIITWLKVAEERGYLKAQETGNYWLPEALRVARQQVQFAEAGVLPQLAHLEERADRIVEEMNDLRENTDSKDE